MEIIKVGKAYEKQGIKVILYGPAGSGKTYSITTLPEPDRVLILSAEAGLMSIRKIGKDLDAIIISSNDELKKCFDFLNSSGGDKYNTVVLDSLTEIAEQVLHDEKANAKDPRAAYGELQTTMIALIKAFRDLPGKNVLFLCKLERVKDDNGAILYGPAMPGNRLPQEIPYLTDLVFAARSRTEADSSTSRCFQTQPCPQYQAKDRSGAGLEQYEVPDWSVIFKKIDDTF